MSSAEEDSVDASGEEEEEEDEDEGEEEGSDEEPEPPKVELPKRATRGKRMGKVRTISRHKRGTGRAVAMSVCSSVE